MGWASGAKGRRYGSGTLGNAWVLVLDESQRGDVLAIGGFLAPARELSRLVDEWRELKQEQLGIDPSSEVKFTMPEEHPTRQVLDGRGITRKDLCPILLQGVRDMGILLLADVVFPVLDNLLPWALYVDALKWCIRRFANHVEMDVRGSAEGPHWVLVDMPPSPGEIDQMPPRLQDLYKYRGTAPFDGYQRLYWEPEDFGSGRRGTPLRDLDFGPTLVAAHARHSDLLQIADAVAGCVAEFCEYNLRKLGASGQLPSPTYREKNLAVIAGAFRRGPKGVKGYGFDFFPEAYLGQRSIVERLEELAGRRPA